MLSKEEPKQGILLTYGKSLIRGLVLSILLVFVSALLYYYAGLSEESFETATWIIIILGICFGSIYGAMKIGSRGFLHGALIGGLYIVVLGIIAFLVEQGEVSLRGFLVKLVMALVIGALSGMIGMVLNKE